MDYKVHRRRLLEEFILLGSGQGCSIPANQRDDRRICFGDGTLYLGWYMAVLATEKDLDYELINDALLSLERLMHPCGYFIRDDVTEFKGLQVKSDFLGSNIHMKEESQDQVIHLLMGLLLVLKFASQQRVISRAKWLIEKIIGWLARNYWIIRNPELGMKIVERGPYAFFFSYPLSLICPKFRRSVWLIFKIAWKYVMRYFIPRVYTTTNLHLVSAIAAASNGWGKNTVKYLLRLVGSNGWYIYPMINAVLYPTVKKLRQLRVVEDKIEQLLSRAPEEGPSYDSSSPWRVAHLFLTEKERQWGTGPPWAEGMRFSGLDCMLLYNITKIVFGSS